MVTISEVAKAAGVSPSTVSYVLSGKRRISEQTQRRVRQAIDTLGYHPNAGARALASRRTRTLGLLAPACDDLTAGVIRQFINAMLTAARGHDHDLVLLNPAEGTQGIRRVTVSALVDGVIVMDVDKADSRVGLLEELRTPTVIIGVPDSPGGLPCVDLDFQHAARLAVQHLAQHGRRHLALLESPAHRKSYAVRTRTGFTTMARSLDLSFTAHRCHPTPDDVRAWVDALERDHPHTTGIVVQNEAALPHLLTCLRQRNRQIPNDISIVAICPRAIAEQQELPLTYVDIPAADLGAAAVDALLQTTPPPPVQLLSPRLYEHASCSDLLTP
ncbi:LacI family DNA-binding transcriptional regulator [Actinomadura rudentiformis]|uniref:LacI family transcriptional regulator n=1 Tax=Actinomadura rudentiformis TaxID=359158 RepID=A0A6H9YMS7_9ACTN|nr:LacI family DNA-binding transcriptional regulator [Actinomadura rudentiformis]KAB2343618.1 LacI family transcriptional regulator [Actinomadura rudentiformis]